MEQRKVNYLLIMFDRNQFIVDKHSVFCLNVQDDGPFVDNLKKTRKIISMD